MKTVGIHEVIYSTGDDKIYKIEKISNIKYGHVSSGFRHWEHTDYRYKKMMNMLKYKRCKEIKRIEST